MRKKRGQKSKDKDTTKHLILKIIVFLLILASFQIIDRYTNTDTIPPNKIYLEVFLFSSLFLFVAYKGLNEHKHHFNPKETIIFGIIAIIIMVGVFSDDTTLNQRMEHGFTEIYNGEMHFDRTSILAPSFGINTVSNSYWLWESDISNEGDKLEATK